MTDIVPYSDSQGMDFGRYVPPRYQGYYKAAKFVYKNRGAFKRFAQAARAKARSRPYAPRTKLPRFRTYKATEGRGLRETRKCTQSLSRYHDSVGNAVSDYILHPLSYHSSAPTLRAVTTYTTFDPDQYVVYLNVTDHIESSGGTNVARDRKDCSIDITHIDFEIDLINYSKDDNKLVRMLFAQSKKTDRQIQTQNIWDEFFDDPNDECGLIDFGTALDDKQFSTEAYQNLPINKDMWKPLVEKKTEVLSYLRSGIAAGNGGRTYGFDPRQNEKCVKFTWKPKIPFRLQWKKDNGTQKLEAQKQLIMFMWASQKTLEPNNFPVVEDKMSYKLKYTVNFKDVL